MSLKRSFEDDESLEECYESDYDNHDEEDEDDEEQVEDFGHVRNLLSEQNQPATKKPKLETSCLHESQTKVSGGRILKLLQDSSNDKASSASKSNLPRTAGKENELPTCSGDNPASTSNKSFETDDCDVSFLISKKNIRRSGGFDPSRPSWLTGLPDEVLVRIFGFLPKSSLSRCAQTCKKLRRVAYDETLWKRVDLGGKSLNAGVIGQLLSRGATIMRLARAFVASPIYDSQFGIQFPKLTPSRLQYLDLSMVTINLVCLEHLLSSCVSLKKLSLENCQVSDKICQVLAKQNCQTLEILHMAMVTGLSQYGICKIIESCQKLEELNLGWTNLTTSMFDFICATLPTSLTKLNISGHRESLLDHHVKTIVQRCPKIVDLDLSDCSSLQSSALESICDGLKSLESLSTSRCYGIPPPTFLILKTSSVRYLNLFGSLKEAALAELKKFLPNVEINKFLFSSIARPTVGIKRTSIWNLRVRD